MAGDLTIRLRRVGERRTWPLRRPRADYEVLIHDGESELYRARTTVPSAALVAKGKVHTTDSYDWVRAADEAYERYDAAWISDPLRLAADLPGGPMRPLGPRRALDRRR